MTPTYDIATAKKWILNNKLWAIPEKDLDCNPDMETLFSMFCYFSYVLPFISRNKYGEQTVLDHSYNNLFGTDHSFLIRANHGVQLDCAIKLHDLISTHKPKNILNVGTGSGVSLSFMANAARKYNAQITTIDHIETFSNICKENFAHASEIYGYDFSKNIDFLCRDLIKFKSHPQHAKYGKIFNTRQFMEKYAKQRLFCYDYIPDKKFDFVLIDGPPIFRSPTLMSVLDSVVDNGIICFEYCRKDIGFLKALGLSLHEYGRPQAKLKEKKYKIFSISWVKAFALRSLLAKYL